MLYAKNNEDFKQRRLRAIRNDFDSGATQLARNALADLADYAEDCDAANIEALNKEILDLALALQQCRPSVATLATLIQAFIEKIQTLSSELTLNETRQAYGDIAEEVSQAAILAGRQAAQNLASKINKGSRLITHSCSANVMYLCDFLGEQLKEVIITESRPSMEGRTLARYLSKIEMPVQYITEAQIGNFIQQADLAVTGANTLLQDGSLINKSGTRLLALAARDAGIPFYVCAESFKHRPLMPEAITLEEMPAEELGLPQLAHVRARNLYFDLTPARLVTAWADEQGVTQTFINKSS
ncbi:translation initiation factor eIF-2B subunit delta [Allopseudospirillum japonicum]|uniref:Translation initiation factor eIF-2B subunit delta n=1 Tax=Allopseudospirillum japonicum TaxID=64971 RepID=A0A1H6TH72_9GAMM|nr:hypothetical protein [Allopseudospirillum japonicum]SEI75575.1 translation initiation factor eIF-2B subunit delta [Allopseudospirillum japonicum]